MQAWINLAPDNSTISLLPKGCYRIDGTITLMNRSHLTLEGNDATLKALTTGDRTRRQVLVSGGTDITVKDLTVQGANPGAGAVRGAYHSALEAQHAFAISGATNVLLDRVQASDLYGDFVYIGRGGPDHQPSQNVTVSNSKFARSGRQGISITDARNVTIESNVIEGAARSLFDIEPNTKDDVVRSIRIVDNVTGAATNFWLADKGSAADVGDIEISNNLMTAGTGGLLFVFARQGAYRGPFSIVGNRFIAQDHVHDEGSSGAFFFAHAANVTIENNTVTFPKGAAMPAVELRDSHHVMVTGNTFTNAGRTVLATAGSSDFVIH